MANKSNSKETFTLVLSLLVTLGLLGFGVWFFRNSLPFASNQQTQPSVNSSGQQTATPSTVQAFDTSSLDTSLPNSSVLTIDGSVTIVALIKQLQIAFNPVNPSLPTTYGLPNGSPNGTNKGIQNLRDGKVLMAASSRPLKADEAQAGLVQVPIARDALAVAVGVNNPYKGELTIEQLKGIFQGKITNWSQVGGPNLPIKVINRSPDSGTYTFFQEVVLLEESFAPDSTNFTTIKKDETTALLRELGDNGITYSTVSQLENQKTVRIVSVNGISPTDQAAIKNSTYPISRVVYLVVPRKTSPGAKQFIDFAISPGGQQIVQRVGFIPLK
ncbi:MAG: phosphate ABC transporter substrate-binding protein [Brasilonema angustatum HA4187-MV1]|jgi:phosphate transport system substrate-binding protein|nr:phosphate ABC transporter substrate-binding protein [Brasilonema angustatum HA4187-MV1]